MTTHTPAAILRDIAARGLAQDLADACAPFGALAAEACSRSILRPHAHARQAFWYALYVRRDWSLRAIAELFGVDHTTVHHGINAHERRAA